MKKKLIFSFFITLISSVLCIIILSLNNKVLASSKSLDINIYDFKSSQEGDCSIITYDDVEIMIDTCKGKETFTEIKEKMNPYMESDSGKVWDYLIITHQDYDHIANAKNVMNYLVDSGWTIGHVIDFDIFTSESVGKEKGYVSNTDNSLYNFNFGTSLNKQYFYSTNCKRYITQRTEFIKSGKIEEYFSASWLTSSSLTKEYDLGGPKLTILYNYFDNYEVMTNWKSSGELKSSTLSYAKNVMSVCALLTYQNKKALFTGDLAEYSTTNDYLNFNPIDKESISSDAYNKYLEDINNYEITESRVPGGERMLLAYHRDLLKDVDFYKAAHHGSRSSNSEPFIDCIKPKYIAVTKGPSSIGKFPSGPAMSNFLKYTDYIYITKITLDTKEENLDDTGEEKEDKTDDKTFDSLYGNVSVSITSDNISIKTDGSNKVNTSSNNNIGVFEAKYDSDSNYRDYLLESKNNEIPYSIYNFGSSNFGSCSLLKIGHYDILIDCGSLNPSSTDYIDKIKEYCIDGVLEYVIVSKPGLTSYSELIGTYKNNKSEKNGVFDNFKILNLIDFGSANPYGSNTSDSGWYKKYQNRKCEDKDRKYSSINKKEEFSILEDLLSLTVYPHGNVVNNSSYEYSISSVFTFKNKYKDGDESNAIFVGDSTDYSQIENLKNVIYFRAPSINANNIKDSLEKINPANIIIGSNLGYTFTSGEEFGSKEYLSILCNGNVCQNVYTVGFDEKKEYKEANDGSLRTKISFKVTDNMGTFSTNIYSIDRHRSANSEKVNSYIEKL